MPSKRDDFEQWLFEMDDRLDAFVKALPTDISTNMDYSAKSLSILEGWLMTRYESVNDILKEAEKLMLDMASRYVGETLRKNLGGVWNIDLRNKKNVFYRLPVIENQGSWTECPVTLVTASMDRRSGAFMLGVVTSLAQRCGVK